MNNLNSKQTRRKFKTLLIGSLAAAGISFASVCGTLPSASVDVQAASNNKNNPQLIGLNEIIDDHVRDNTNYYLFNSDQYDSPYTISINNDNISSSNVSLHLYERVEKDGTYDLISVKDYIKAEPGHDNSFTLGLKNNSQYIVTVYSGNAASYSLSVNHNSSGTSSGNASSDESKPSDISFNKTYNHVLYQRYYNNGIPNFYLFNSDQYDSPYTLSITNDSISENYVYLNLYERIEKNGKYDLISIKELRAEPGHDNSFTLGLKNNSQYIVRVASGGISSYSLNVNHNSSGTSSGNASKDKNKPSVISLNKTYKHVLYEKYYNNGIPNFYLIKSDSSDYPYQFYLSNDEISEGNVYLSLSERTDENGQYKYKSISSFTVTPGHSDSVLPLLDKNTDYLIEVNGNSPITYSINVGHHSVMFEDVTNPNNAFYSPIYWAVDKNITTGMGNNLFKPDDPCTRGQVVTFLWRLAGEPEPTTYKTTLKDLNSNSAFYKAILWAAENNITTGFNDNTFRQDDSCTRGQIVTFIWRYANRPTSTGNIKPLSDVKKDGNAFYDAIMWAIGKKITTGFDDGTFKQDNTCTRGQVVTFLYRYK